MTHLNNLFNPYPIISERVVVIGFDPFQLLKHYAFLKSDGKISQLYA